MRVNGILLATLLTVGSAATLPASADPASTSTASTSTASTSATSTSAAANNPALTSKVKAMFAAKYHAPFATIQIATDADGVVWLSGTAPTADACAMAAQIASDTDGVAAVHNRIVVRELVVRQ